MSGHLKFGLLSLLSLITALAVGCATASPGPETQPPAAAGGQPATPAGEKPRYGGVISLFAGADPPSFDQQKESTFNVERTFSPAYDNLVRWAPLEPEKMVPDLAEKWELSPDGKTLTFTLRQGVKFHNGNDFTSDDVKFTLDRIRGAITEGPGALVAPRKNLVGAIERIETPDSRTAVVRLKYPQASLLPYLANHLNPVYDKEWVEAGHPPTTEVNGTGPFRFKNYTRGTVIEHERNADYWNKPFPYADGVKVYVIPDSGTQIAALRTGQVKFMEITPAHLEVLRPQVDTGTLKGELNLVKTRADSARAGVFVNTTKPPFDDVRVRKALTLAVDRTEAMKVAGVAASDGAVRGWLIPGSFWALPPEELAKMPGYGTDKVAERAEARRLLAEAGYPNGMTVTGLTRNEQIGIDNSVIFADQFAKVGITMKIETQDIAIVYERLEKRDYQLGSTLVGAGTTEEPDTIYGQFHVCGSPRNYSGFCDPKVNDLFARQSQTLDPQERRKLVWELEKLVLQLVPSLSEGFSRSPTWGVRTDLRGFVPHPTEYNHSRLDVAWLSK